jgi:hypothetical protein
MRTVLRFAAVLAAAFPACIAHAQLFRAYLSSSGSDANPCSVAAPCRLLPAAINAVTPGGEVWILDSANFNTGTVAIAKSVSILAVPGQVASLVALSNAPAISISGDVKVGLRNVVVTDLATAHGTDGISVTGGSAQSLLSVENSLFVNLQGHGISVHGTPGRVTVKGSDFRNNLGYAVMAADGPTVEIADSRLFANLNGGVASFGSIDSTSTIVNVTDSTIASCGSGPGVIASVNANAATKVMVTRSTIHDCGFALYATAFGGPGSPLVVVSNSTISGNQVGVAQGAGGVVRSLGNNYIEDNGPDIGTLTPSATR